jgi:capsular exopolysaccharide synthesis family protein
LDEKLGLPLLGVIPSMARGDDNARALFVHSNPHSAAAECLRSIRTNVLFMSPDRPLRTILITSSAPGEGKTTTATSLAEIMADSGNRVLLIDADMRRPRLQSIFGITDRGGLSSLILGEGRFDRVVRSTDVPNLFILPCGPVPPNPTELLHAAAFKTVLASATERFDRVIIDSPPAGVVADAVVVSTQVDGTLFVVKSGKTSQDAAIRTVRAIADVNGRFLGAVLNDLDIDDRRYGAYCEYYGHYSPRGETGGPEPREDGERRLPA